MINVKPRLRATLLAATLAVSAVGVAAFAQSEPTYDPSQLPAIKGQVAEYSLSPRGDVDGLILKDGTQVHLPPFLGTQLVFAVKPGDTVTIHGLKARDLPLVQAMQVTNDASNVSVTDAGPRAGGPGPKGYGPRDHRPKDHGPKGPHGAMMGQAMDAQGTIKAQLHGPRGDLNGVLLEDGTIVSLPPPEARRMEAQLAVGKTLAVKGPGIDNPLGRLIAAREIGASKDSMTQVQASWWHRDGPGHDRHGPPPGAPASPL